MKMLILALKSFSTIIDVEIDTNGANNFFVSTDVNVILTVSTDAVNIFY